MPPHTHQNEFFYWMLRTFTTAIHGTHRNKFFDWMICTFSTEIHGDKLINNNQMQNMPLHTKQNNFFDWFHVPSVPLSTAQNWWRTNDKCAETNADDAGVSKSSLHRNTLLHFEALCIIKHQTTTTTVCFIV